LTATNISPTWTAVFVTISAFAQTGLTTTNANLITFNNNAYMLLCLSVVIILGKIGYPSAIRAIVVALYRWGPIRLQQPTKALLVRPRIYYTYIFPSDHNNFLLLELVLLTVVQWILWMSLNWNRTLFAGLPAGLRFVNMIMATVSTRAAGFTSVAFTGAHPAVLLMLCLVMYASDYPLISAIQETAKVPKKFQAHYANVLPANIQAHINQETVQIDTSGSVAQKKKRKSTSSGSFSVRFKEAWKSSLIRETCYLLIGTMAVLIAEIDKFDASDPDYSIFNVVFECVSAFAGCGLSFGSGNFPPFMCGVAYTVAGSYASLSVRFTAFSKLVVIAIMVMG